MGVKVNKIWRSLAILLLLLFALVDRAALALDWPNNCNSVSLRSTLETERNELGVGFAEIFDSPDVSHLRGLMIAIFRTALKEAGKTLPRELSDTGSEIGPNAIYRHEYLQSTLSFGSVLGNAVVCDPVKPIVHRTTCLDCKGADVDRRLRAKYPNKGFSTDVQIVPRAYAGGTSSFSYTYEGRYDKHRNIVVSATIHGVPRVTVFYVAPAFAKWIFDTGMQMVNEYLNEHHSQPEKPSKDEVERRVEKAVK